MTLFEIGFTLLGLCLGFAAYRIGRLVGIRQGIVLYMQAMQRFYNQLPTEDKILYRNHMKSYNELLLAKAAQEQQQKRRLGHDHWNG